MDTKQDGPLKSKPNPTPKPMPEAYFKGFFPVPALSSSPVIHDNRPR